MLCERVYRWLLVAYPREHRREYAELMVQLFRDRMRRDGGGFRALTVWVQMIFDLVVAAFKQHKEGVDMTKRMWIGAAVVVVLLTGVAGVSTLLAQSKGREAGEVMVSVGHYTRSFQDEGASGLSGAVRQAVRQAVEEGVITQQAADEIVRALDELPVEGSSRSRGDRAGEVVISSRHESNTFPGAEADRLAEAMRRAMGEGVTAQDAADEIARAFGGDSPETVWRHFSFSGADGLAEAMQQAVKKGVIAQVAADQIVRSLGESPARTGESSDGNGPARVWHHFSFAGADGFAEAMRQAVEEGVIAQETADQLLRSFEDKDTGS